MHLAINNAADYNVKLLPCPRNCLHISAPDRIFTPDATVYMLL